MFGISNYYCLDTEEYEMEGNFYRTEMKYLELKLWKC